ncbi:MAG: alkaline phosphatase family protein, partial [Myxococcales bacterium]|nr:alkaline phosphatase family protein [Myxococcales bacterium]
LAHVRRVIALDPRAHLLAYHIAGRAAVMLKDWETAEGMFRRLGELSARHANLARDDLALLRRTRLQERDIPSDRMISVRFRVRGSDAVRPKRLSIAGSWTDDGHYDDLRGWKWRPMEREADGTWTASAQMRVFSPFGYGFVLDDDEDPTTGALYDDRLMFHEMETIPEEVTVDVALTPDRVQPPVHRAPWVQRPADGRRSVFVFWLDSGCWPDLKPILMKGQAPAIAQFLDGAAHGSLWAEKALTAKALQALTGFNRLDHYTLLNLTTDLVREMQANAAVGNYFDFVRPTTLDWLDGQETLTIWDVVQRNRRVGLNLIFSDQAAFDPNDALLLTAEGERVALRDRMAPVVVEEGEDWRTILARILGRPVADASQGWMERFILINYRDALRKHRTAVEAIRAFRPEIAVVRYPELDHMSHQFFDGRQERIPGEEGAAAPRPYARVLENFYKFNDELLSEALALTDEDDAVFLISDHGILNNFVHAPVALLMARGSGIEASGFVGRHDNHDFPLTLMRLLGVEVPERPRYRAIDALLEAPEAPPTGP